jgi:hypothetical protein
LVGESVTELNPGDVYGIHRYVDGVTQNPKPLRFVGMNGSDYVFDDLDQGGQIKYNPNQIDSINGTYCHKAICRLSNSK